MWAGQLLKTKAPARKWLVSNWIPKNQVHLLSGDGGTGKSTLVLQLAASIAIGASWLGMEVEQGRVLVMSAEDDLDEMHYRLENIIQGIAGNYEEKRKAFDNIALLDVSADLESTLATYDEKKGGLAEAPLFPRVLKAVRDNNIDTIFIDSAADVFPEELHRHAVRSFLRKLRTLGCTVVLLAHPSVSGMKDGRGFSGSTHWSNGVRSRSTFKRILDNAGKELDEDLRRYELPKSNRSKAKQKLTLRWTETGFEVYKEAEAGLDKLARQLKAKEVFIELLKLHNAQGRLLSDRPASWSSYAPGVFEAHPDNKDRLSKAEFAHAMEILFGEGKIEIGLSEEGPPSKRRSCLKVKEVAPNEVTLASNPC